MYFSHQPSGGRGEYELAGTFGSFDAASLSGDTFLLDTIVYGIKPTGLILSDQGGKRRLRAPSRGPMVQRQVAGLLMLPHSTRDSSGVSGGLPVVIERRYILDQLHIASLNVARGMATVRLGDLLLYSNRPSQPSLTETISYPERIERVAKLHARLNEFPEPLASELRRHRDSVTGDSIIGTSAEVAVSRIMLALNDPLIEAVYLPKTDPLPALENLLGLAPEVQPPTPSQTARDELEIRRREVILLRLRRARGPSAARFRKEVQTAYNWRCLFCGLRLPKGDYYSRPGVDAAHILPYGDYDLDVVQNGLCLCKLHHWAFDEQLLILSASEKGYEVTLSGYGTMASQEDRNTRAELVRVVGRIPRNRLPLDTGKWPSRKYLAKLYEDVPPA